MFGQCSCNTESSGVRGKLRLQEMLVLSQIGSGLHVQPHESHFLVRTLPGSPLGPEGNPKPLPGPCQPPSLICSPTRAVMKHYVHFPSAPLSSILFPPHTSALAALLLGMSFPKSSRAPSYTSYRCRFSVPMSLSLTLPLKRHISRS